MFSTSLAAMVGVVAVSAALPSQPAWQSDYAAARAVAAQQGKPLAVFIGQGSPAVGADSARALSDNFVCVKVDTATDSGRTVAGSFGLTEGVVLSDRTGALQAVRHSGPVTDAELSGYMGQANAAQTVPVMADLNLLLAPAASGQIMGGGMMGGGMMGGGMMGGMMGGMRSGGYAPAPSYGAPAGGCGGSCGGGVPVSSGCGGGSCGGGKHHHGRKGGCR